ncbi:hypothetical protein [Dongia sp.]|uniref:hypothetical protein n=1 Tax=Dongia sp. TaxID=1977262 RepID=UPI0035ADEC5C
MLVRLRRISQILAAGFALVTLASLPAAAGDYRKNPYPFHHNGGHNGGSYPAHGSYFQPIPGFGWNQNPYGHKPQKWRKHRQHHYQPHWPQQQFHQPYRHPSFKPGQVIYLPPPPPGRAYYYRNGRVYLWP